jgi:hypothetical protein
VLDQILQVLIDEGNKVIGVFYGVSAITSFSIVLFVRHHMNQGFPGENTFLGGQKI